MTAILAHDWIILNMDYPMFINKFLPFTINTWKNYWFFICSFVKKYLTQIINSNCTDHSFSQQRSFDFSFFQWNLEHIERWMKKAVDENELICKTNRKSHNKIPSFNKWCFEMAPIEINSSRLNYSIDNKATRSIYHVHNCSKIDAIIVCFQFWCGG